MINARTDTFLLGLGANPEERLRWTIERGSAYMAAGADVIFVPVALDLDIVRALADGIPGPVNVMAGAGAPLAGELFAAGARRVSIGASAMLATLGLVQDAAREMRSAGTWSAMERSHFGFGDAQALFRRD